MAAHDDDPLDAELVRREHEVQPDRAVTDHDDGTAGGDLGSSGREPAGVQHVGRGEVAGYQIGIGHQGVADEHRGSARHLFKHCGRVRDVAGKVAGTGGASGSAVATEVEADQPLLVGQVGDQPRPRRGALRDAVRHEHRRCVGRRRRLAGRPGRPCPWALVVRRPQAGKPHSDSASHPGRPEPDSRRPPCAHTN